MASVCRMNIFIIIVAIFMFLLTVQQQLHGEK